MSLGGNQDIYLGCSNGTLKGVSLHSGGFVNVNDGCGSELSRICWSTPTNQSDILCANLSAQLNLMDCDSGQCRNVINMPHTSGSVVGLDTFNGSNDVLVGMSSGVVSLFHNETYDKKGDLNVGLDVCSVAASPTNSNRIASGGRENLLKVWDLQSPQTPLFTAKNVAPDFLQLRKPVWVADLKHLADSESIVTCTGHSQIRVYDPRSRRRPVLETEWNHVPFTSLDIPANDNQVVAGNTQGAMALFDLRLKGRMVQTYRGFSGGIRCIRCHPTLPYIFSCGADRFTRVHHLDTKNMVHKIYCKVGLNCLIISPNLTANRIESIQEEAVGKGKVKTEPCDEAAATDDEDDDDEVWESIANQRTFSKLDDHSVMQVKAESDADTKSPERKKRRIGEKGKKRGKRRIPSKEHNNNYATDIKKVKTHA